MINCFDHGNGVCMVLVNVKWQEVRPKSLPRAALASAGGRS